MNKEEMELIQKQVDKKYLETQEYGRNQFVCKIVELERYIDTLQSELDIANKKIEEIKKYLGSNEFFEGTHFDTNYDDDIVKFNEEVDRVIKKVLSIIGGE